MGEAYTLELLAGEERYHRFTGTEYHWGIRRPDGSLAFRLRQHDFNLAERVTNNLNAPPEVLV